MTVTELKTPPETERNNAAFRHILVATDFSEPAHRALCDALLLAKENGARLSVVHVLYSDIQLAALENPPEIDLDRLDAERHLKELISELKPEQPVETLLLRHGPVADVVESLIREQDIDLLVIGTRGRGGLRKLALGSVAEQLLRVSPCPVMTIGPNADIAPLKHGPGFHSILFATDFGPASTKALPLAVALARNYQAKLVLLHMIPPIPATTGSLSAWAPASLAADELQEWEAISRRRAMRELKQCLPAKTGLAEEPEYVVGTEFLPEGILMAVRKFHADLIVMGANRTHFARTTAHAPWTAVHEVLRDAPCPVLTVAG